MATTLTSPQAPPAIPETGGAPVEQQPDPQAPPSFGENNRHLPDALKAAVGKTVAVTTKVDPSILGGLVVRVGSRMVDSSLKSKLQRLKLSMKGVG